MAETPSEQPLADGYCVIENVLQPDMLADLQRLAGRCVAAITPEHRARYRSEGSLVLMADYPEFARIIGYPPALRAFAELGLDDVRFSSGYVISKPPASPALFWHQDWWGWDHPVSFSDRIVQFFAFYYLTDTTADNGCRRGVDTDPDADPLSSPDNWPEPYCSMIEQQRPDYRGSMEPQTWNRSPDGLA